jgi:putative ABC transport system substrate-binding protein
MAVELAKLAIWLETVAVDSPLAFLDHHLQPGDSLIGARIDRLDSLPGKALVSGFFKEELAQALPTLLEPLSEIRGLSSSRTTPIIFVMVSDPVGSGFVASLPRPGGNVTGFTAIEGSLGGKWVELLKEIAPQVTRVVLLFNPAMATYAEYYLHPFKVGAASLGVEAIIAPVHDSSELESAVATQAREPNSGLIIMPDAFLIGHRAQITSLAARYRAPAVYWSRFFAELGGLISYGPSVVDEYRRAASYADRILRGAKPSELPVQAPIKFELVINLKTARTLALEIPPTLLARADEVIE